MRVLTWNLWWQFGPWEQRQPAITQELLAVAPDIALLQEVWCRDGQDQAEHLASAAGLHLQRTQRSDGSAQEFGNAILSRWPIETVEQITLSGLDGSPSHRSALMCSVVTPTEPLLVVVTHLAWQYDQSLLRQQQLSEIADLVLRHRVPDRPVVLAGDLNAVPDTDEMRRLTGLAPAYRPELVFTDCWAAVGEGDGHTWTRRNPHSAEALWPRRRLDYVLVSWPRPKPWCNPISARLVGVDAYDGMVPSDHYGVAVELDDRPPEDKK